MLKKGDPLRDETTVPGVSDVGIEVRRADKRQPGIFAHGYARVSTPEFHRQRAINYLKARLQRIKDAPKPKLTKKDGDAFVKKPDPGHEYRRQMMYNAAKSDEKKRIKDMVSFFMKQKRPIESRHILLSPDHLYYNPLFSDHDRVQMFQEVAQELKVPKDTPIMHNHTHKTTAQLSIPESNPESAPVETQKPPSDLHLMGYGGYMLPKRRLGKNEALQKLVRCLKKVDPQTKLPGILFNKKAAEGVDEEKFDSCVEQVKEKSGKKVNPYAVCNAALKKEQKDGLGSPNKSFAPPQVQSVMRQGWERYKKQSQEPSPSQQAAGQRMKESAINRIYQMPKLIQKDDQPHPSGSPEDRAHDVVEQNKPVYPELKAVKKQGQDALKRFAEHLKMLADKSQWRSPKNVK